MKFIQADVLKQKPTDESKLGFGKIFTDYMFTMKYKVGQGWYDAQIEPHRPIAFDLATTVFHYAQGIFEGLKAFKNEKGEIRVFRPEENFKRMNRSAVRMCIPEIDEKLVLEGAFRTFEDRKGLDTHLARHGALYPSQHRCDQRGARRARGHRIPVLYHPVARRQLLRARTGAHAPFGGGFLHPARPWAARARRSVSPTTPFL